MDWNLRTFLTHEWVSPYFSPQPFYPTFLQPKCPTKDHLMKKVAPDAHASCYRCNKEGEKLVYSCYTCNQNVCFSCSIGTTNYPAQRKSKRITQVLPIVNAFAKSRALLGNWFCSGIIEIPFMRVSKQILSFPLSEYTCKKLFENRSIQSETCVLIGPSEIEFDSSWQEEISKIKGNLENGRSIQLEFHSMLVCEAGSLVPSRDVLNSHENHIANIFVVLPVINSGTWGETTSSNGGELCIREPNSRSNFVAFKWSGKCQGVKSSWVSISVDCPYEWKSFRSGYWVALVYKVIVNSKEDVVDNVCDHGKEELHNEESIYGEPNKIGKEEQRDIEEMMPYLSTSVCRSVLDVVATALRQRPKAFILLNNYYVRLPNRQELLSSDRTLYELLEDSYAGHVSIIQTKLSHCESDNDFKEMRLDKNNYSKRNGRGTLTTDYSDPIDYKSSSKWLSPLLPNYQPSMGLKLVSTKFISLISKRNLSSSATIDSQATCVLHDFFVHFIAKVYQEACKERYYTTCDNRIRRLAGPLNGNAPGDMLSVDLYLNLERTEDEYKGQPAYEESPKSSDTSFSTSSPSHDGFLERPAVTLEVLTKSVEAVSDICIRSALKSVLSKDLADDAIDEGENAVEAYRHYSTQQHLAGNMAQMTGLYVHPEHIAVACRTISPGAYMTTDAAIFLAGVVQSFTQRILEGTLSKLSFFSYRGSGEKKCIRCDELLPTLEKLPRWTSLVNKILSAGEVVRSCSEDSIFDMDISIKRRECHRFTSKVKSAPAARRPGTGGVRYVPWIDEEAYEDDEDDEDYSHIQNLENRGSRPRSTPSLTEVKEKEPEEDEIVEEVGRVEPIDDDERYFCSKSAAVLFSLDQIKDHKYLEKTTTEENSFDEEESDTEINIYGVTILVVRTGNAVARNWRSRRHLAIFHSSFVSFYSAATLSRSLAIAPLSPSSSSSSVRLRENAMIVLYNRRFIRHIASWLGK